MSEQAREQSNKSLAQLIAEFDSEPEGTEGDRQWFFDELAVKITERGEPGCAFLLTVLDRPDDERVESAAIGLGNRHCQSPIVVARLVELLTDSRPRVLAMAIWSLTHLRASEADAGVRRLWHHPDPVVRGRAVDYLIRMHPDDAREWFDPSIADEHFIVRESAVDAIDDAAIDDELDPRPFFDDLWPMLNDPHPHVREAVHGLFDRQYWGTRSRYFAQRALTSRNPLRRASALRYVIDWDRGPSADLFRRGLSDPSAVVRIATLDQSHAAGCAYKHVPDLAPMLDDPDPAVRAAAMHAIEERGILHPRTSSET